LKSETADEDAELQIDLSGKAPNHSWPERAKAVAAIADRHADEGDRAGRLSPPVVDALHREGLFGMWVPRSVRGGAELDPVSSLQVIENLANGDPSAGCRPGHAPRQRRPARRRLPPDRLVELCLGHQARDAHPYARDHPGDGRAAHLRAAGGKGDAD
jgi:hypothetical protein